MFPPRWFIPYDALFQLVTSIVALAIGLYAFRGYQWIRERTLHALFLAFMALSLGMLINGLTLGYAWGTGAVFSKHASPLAVIDAGLWVYYLMSIAAYSILVYAYVRRLMDVHVALAAGGMGAMTAGGSLLVAGPLFELVLVALLFIILVAQLAHLMVKKTRNSTIVTVSFTLLLVSHVLVLFSAVEDSIYAVGRLAELAGFLSLLAMLYNLRGSR